MQVREAVAKTDAQYAEEVQYRGLGTFQDRALRDRVAAILKGLGYNVVRRSMSGQNLHPEYVTDYVGTLHTGFGNTQYQTYWPKLYMIHINN